MAVNCKAARKIRFAHVPADGADGDPGISILINPSSVTFNTAAASAREVAVNVYRGARKLKYDEFTCSTLAASSVVTAGLRWAFLVSDDKEFAYRLTYIPPDEINVSIPFFVTVDGVNYPAAIGVQTVKNGTNGTGADGRNGVWIPPMMLWSDYPDDYVFQAGDPAAGDVRLDMVLVKSASGNLIPYFCRESHVKEDSPYSPETDSEFWSPADAGVYKCVATELLAAHNARIDFLSGQAVRVGSGSSMCGYFGAPTDSGAVLFTGADNDAQATFVVYADGRVVASNMHISGSSTFRGFVLHEKTVVTSANFSSLSSLVEWGAGNSWQEIDLLKTGNWLHLKSLPSQSGYLLRLPAIRTGVAYTDAYRDYVRQFLGNEVLIYNDSGQSVSVDSGESSITIRNGFAVHLKMSFAPESLLGSSNSTLLERIKWVWTEPFQF